MTPFRATRRAVLALAVLFFATFGFWAGRLTNSTLKIQGCEVLNYSTPFKGTLP